MLEKILGHARVLHKCATAWKQSASARSKSQSSQAFGSIYRRLGLELADPGTCYDWRGMARDASHTPAWGSDREGSVHKSTGSTPAERFGPAVVLHISWRHTHRGKRWPCRKLKLVSSLEIAANDFVAAVHYMLATYGPQLPVVLVGFSFGGPAAWAAARKLTASGAPPVGVVTLAGAGRDGPGFREHELDTLGCALRCRQAGVSALLLHGSADENVAIEVSEYLYSNLGACEDTQAALALAVVPGSAHLFNIARDIVFAAMKDWVLACASGVPAMRTSAVPFVAGPIALQLRARGRVEPFAVKLVPRKFLLKRATKGYSEKESC